MCVRYSGIPNTYQFLGPNKKRTSSEKRKKKGNMNKIFLNRPRFIAFSDFFFNIRIIRTIYTPTHYRVHT